ncbi:sigma-70 family RNA polymerase sigma factor [Lysinibacillus sp. LZ02]|uniref:sigma-70 family RNA polymerase sigma factor n=1 Tax=Lysinibacillus sp. LZ02 TaxID=3420668 RepID=UPI003D36A444
MELEQLIETYSDYLYQIAFIYVKDERIAEEVVQDVFFTYYKKREQFQGKSSLKTYLVKMTINRSYDYLRSWKARSLPLFQLFESKVERADQPLLKKETRGEVVSAVLTLPVKYREVLLFYYYEHMTTKEIAQFLATPESTIKSRLQRARQELKPKLAKIDWEVLFDE